MAELDFEKTRWKLADDLTPEEVTLIVANKDKLNDEEKAAFSMLLSADSPLEEEIQNSTDLPENTDPDTQIKEEEENPIDEAKPVEAKLPENVITQDKLDSYIETKRKEWDAEGKTKAEQQKEEAQIKFEVFKKNDKGEVELPSDWNDAINKFAPALLEEAEKRVLAKLEARNKEIAQNQAQMQQTQKEVYDRFEQEFTTLAKNKLIPDPKENPEEYKKTHAAIIKIGDENGKNNITDAYKLWSIIPEEHGGGLKVTASTKARIEAQKAAASKIGSGRGIAGPGKKSPPTYDQIHNARMDDLIESRLAQPF